jgi:hypothetical protein
MRTKIIKQILFSVFCLGFGWYLAAWWADISHQRLSYFSFGSVEFVLPALALIYIGIQKLRRLYLGLLALHYIMFAGWILSLDTMPSDHYLTVVIFVGYAIGQIGAWYAFYHSLPKPQKI